MSSSLFVSMLGNLAVAPAGSGEGGVPGGATTIPYQTNPNPKSVAVSTGDQVTNVATAADVFVTLSMGGVTQGSFLFVIVSGTMTIRTTQGGNTPAVEIISGMKVVEYDPGSPLTLLEASGSGVVEYLVTGPE